METKEPSKDVTREAVQNASQETIQDKSPKTARETSWTFLQSILQELKANRRFMLLCFVLSFILVVATETVFRLHIVSGLSWVARHLYDTIAVSMALSSAMILISAVFKRPVVGAVFISLLYSILSVVNFSLLFFRGTPITLGDLFLGKEVKGLQQLFFHQKFLIALAMALILIAAIVVALVIFLRKKKLGKVLRTAVVYTLLAVVIFLLPPNKGESFLTSFLIPEFSYRFSNNSNLDHIAREIEAHRTKPPVQLKTQKPNIIVIQSEAFFRLNDLGSSVPIPVTPYFDELCKQNITGKAVVSVFGGGTCNSEFEFLSGVTVKGFPDPWHLVFPNDINKPQISMASILRKQGYVTKAFHPFHNWYFNRINVYKYLGFDEFKSFEYTKDAKMLQEALTVDSYITDEILESIRNTKEPLFKVSVTIQNHGPYDSNRYAPEDLKVRILDASLSSETISVMQTYGNGAVMADRELYRLYEELQKIDEPTIVFFYGDHLPMLGADYKAYRETGYLGTETAYEVQTKLSIMSVPFVVFDNFGLVEHKDLGHIGLHYIGPMILNMLNLDMPDYMKDSYALRNLYPAVTNGIAFDAEGVEHVAGDSFYDSYLKYLRDAKEAYFSEGFEEEWLIKDNPEYNQELNNVTITSYDNGKVIGTRLYKDAKLYIDGQETEYDWTSKEEIVLKTPLSSPKGKKVVLKVVDSEGNVLTESNTFEIK